MTHVTASAPGKIILFGEHAVVYGEPALAVPVTDLSARVTIRSGPVQRGIWFEALDLNKSFSAQDEPDSPLATMARITLNYLRHSQPDVMIIIESSIPVAGGLGSGAAVSAALGRALAKWYRQPIDDRDLSGLVYEVEKLHHGTPSGIDNTVICYSRPVWYKRGTEPELLRVREPFQLIIADTGVASTTKAMVSSVRDRWASQPDRFNTIFGSIGEIVQSARAAIENGDTAQLGPLMNDNHRLLEEMGVSSPELEILVAAARRAGAFGAKLSGGGGGGNMIALAAADTTDRVLGAVRGAGAVRVIQSTVHSTGA